MTFILICGMGVLLWKLMQANKSRQIVMNRYIEATNRQYVGQPTNAHLMYDGNGNAHPMWCPNCGRNL